MFKINRYIYVILLLLFIFTIGTGCTFFKNKAETETVESKYVPVEVTAPFKKTIYNEILYTGTVHPEKEIIILPKTPGKVSEIMVKTGDSVEEGDTLFTLDKKDMQDQIEQAKIALDGAIANYNMTLEKIETAQRSYERNKQLFEQGSISESQIEQAELAASDKPLKIAQNSVDQARFAYEKSIKALDNMEISSPINGIISSLNVEKGEYALNTQPSAVIINMDNILVRIDVAENIINSLSIEQELSVSIPASSNKPYIGTITFISPTSNERTLLFPVDIKIQNKNHHIKPGMFAHISIKSDIRENVLVVPSDAVVRNNDNNYIYLEQDGKAIQTVIETGMDTGEYIEVLGGLDIKDSIIIKGQSFVKDGDSIKVVGGVVK